VLAALIIVFREVFEAGLIVGIVLAVTGSVAHRFRWIGGGVLAGVVAACLVAAFAGALSQLFEGNTTLLGGHLPEVRSAQLLQLIEEELDLWIERHGARSSSVGRLICQA